MSSTGAWTNKRRDEELVAGVAGGGRGGGAARREEVMAKEAGKAERLGRVQLRLRRRDEERGPGGERGAGGECA